MIWNPAAINLCWQGVAVMSRCYYTHRQRYLVAGFLRSKVQISDGQWWCYDVVCPGCQQFDFAPVDADGVDFGQVESATKSRMTNAKGRITKIVENGSCALVEFPDGAWKLHLPLRVLLPSNYEALCSRSR